MKKKFLFVFILIFSFSVTIIYAKNLTQAEESVKVVDRVCKMQIDKDEAKTLKKDGHKYYFCSKNCKTAFKKNPEKYACICPSSSDGCNCYHCTGNGELCDCAEIEIRTGSPSVGHAHEDNEQDGGHH